MKTTLKSLILIATSVLGLSACILVEHWKPRQCVITDSDKVSALKGWNTVNSPLASVMRDLRNQIARAGYTLGNYTVEGGYIRGDLIKDLCKEDRIWDEDLGYYTVCDANFPRLRRSRVEGFVDPLNAHSSRLQISISDEYYFESGEWRSDVCPEDYRSILIGIVGYLGY